jgi:hypothetical protein
MKKGIAMAENEEWWAWVDLNHRPLFKIGARIRETARCIRIHLASGWPFQDLFQAACNSS